MALYHKHRPQNWNTVVGQDTVTTTIQNQIKNNTPAHAYLLSGPRGVGKTTTARLIAKSLNCEKRQPGEAEPCNECSQCVDITRGAALDVMEIDAASNTGVDMVRENIIENAQFQPTRSQYKIFIIDEVHMLSTSAFNALLKTLEEPPAKTIFILATTEIHKLPATILSRCQRYTFKKIPRDLMAKRLESIVTAEGATASPEIIARLVRASEGSARDAVSLLDQILATAGSTITADDLAAVIPVTAFNRLLELAQVMSRHEAHASLEQVMTLSRDGIATTQFLADLVGFWRGLLLYHFTPAIALTELDCGTNQEAEIKTLAASFSAPELLWLIDLTSKRYTESRSALIAELPLELLVIEAAGYGSATTTPVITKPQPPVAQPIVTPAITPPTTAEKKVEPTPAVAAETKAPVIPEPMVTPVAPVIETPAENNTGATVTKSDIEKIWADFIRSLETNSPSMVFLLRGAKIGTVENNVATIEVGYDFHRDKLSERSTKKNLEDLLAPRLPGRVTLEIVTVVGSQGAPSPLADLADAFGGQVV